MAFTNASRLRFDEIKTKNFDEVTDNYTNFGSTISNPLRAFNIQNMTDQPIMITFDSEDFVDHIFLTSQGFFLFDTATNRTTEGNLYVEAGTQIMVKYTDSAPTEGMVYMTSAYGG